MLGSEAGALAREPAQALGVHPFGAGRIESDGAENGALLEQAGQGAMGWGTGRLARPGQHADRCALSGRQQRIQRFGLRRRQLAG